MKLARIGRTLSLSGLALALATGCARAGNHAGKTEVSPETSQRSVALVPQPALAGAVSIADVAEKAMPSVVNISLTKVSRGPGMQFFPFFGPPDSEERREQGMGSGVIVSADGYVVTNNHVVSDATEIKVTTSDKREFMATVVGTDPKSDVALIKIKDPSGLTPIAFGDSSRARLGEVVLAIGNPFGVGQTVTMGIISAKGRADLGIVAYEDFIQTDAAINPGNSGGALVNMEGKLIGINTAILSRTGGYQGVGFAIPTSMVQPIMESLKKSGKVVRGWLGVSIQDVDQEIASAMKLPSAGGILISDVRPGTPAAKGGLRRGDVVLRVDGIAVSSTGQFRNMIAASGAGKKVTLEILRDGKPATVAVELGEMPDTESAALPGGGPNAPQGGSALDGLTLQAITPEARRAFGIPDDVQSGVVITRVDPKSRAARAGLRPGDVVLEVNRAPVDTIQRFNELYSKSKDGVLLLVNRRGNNQFVVVRR
jgi:serine protease Do